MFIRYKNTIINTDTIRKVNLDDFPSKGQIMFSLQDGSINIANGHDALEILQKIMPSALENHHMIRYGHFDWAIHNLIGHPLMEILNWFGKPLLAQKVHDLTIPNPITK